MASDKKLAELKARQSAAAAALARSNSLANQRKLRKAQKELKDYQASVRVTRGDNSGSRAVIKGSGQGPGFGLREFERPLLAPIDRNDRNQVIWRQTELRNMGADIVVDGVWGPVTEWFEGMANNGDLNPVSGGMAKKEAEAASGGGDGGGGGVPDLGSLVGGGFGGGGFGGGGGPTTWTPPTPTAPPSASLSPADFKTRVLTEIPQAAAFLAIPELVPILQARLDRAISDQEFAAQVQQTEWYRTTPVKARAWLGLYAIDPASAERQIDEQAQKMKQAAGAYAVPVADITAREWAKKELSGEVPEGAFGEYLKEQAKSLFPALSAAIDAGVTVEQYADPYKQIAAQTLEIAPEQINFGDQRWARALAQVDKDGNRTSMTLFDWQNLLKTDASYGYDKTNQARAQATEISERIAQTFGKVA